MSEKIDGGAPMAWRGNRAVMGALKVVHGFTLKDWLRFLAWAAAITFAAGSLYAQQTHIIKQQQDQAMITSGLIDAVQKISASVDLINSELALRVDTAEKEHDRYDHELERIRDRLDGIGRRARGGD